MKITSNMGTADRLIRTFLAILMITFYFTQAISGILGIVLIALSLIFVLTSFISFCPLYLPFHINTKKNKKAKDLK
ncbi:MAG: hypothetical protein JWO58_1595 [Chitinophagaceae bacterium]|nr:hypothetical protein [Chitinophagaceae bacterium]